MTALLDEVCDLDVILKKIGFKDILFVRSKIILCGMSFGGVTAVKVAN
jgi:hypothetical protein